MKYFHSLLLVVLFLLAAGPSFAEFYEYKDRNGNTVITDTPPAGAESRKKTLQEDRIYHSTRSEKDYPAVKDPGERLSRKEMPQKKDYSRVSAVMYMTDW